MQYQLLTNMSRVIYWTIKILWCKHVDRTITFLDHKSSMSVGTISEAVHIGILNSCLLRFNHCWTQNPQQRILFVSLHFQLKQNVKPTSWDKSSSVLLWHWPVVSWARGGHCWSFKCSSRKLHGHHRSWRPHTNWPQSWCLRGCGQCFTNHHQNRD